MFTSLYPAASPGPVHQLDHHIPSTITSSAYPEPPNPVSPKRWDETYPLYGLTNPIVKSEKLAAAYFKRFTTTYLKLENFQRIGKGANGTAYRVPLTPTNIASMRDFYKAAPCLIDGRGMPTRGISAVVVKIEAFNYDRERYPRYLARVARETSVHSYLSNPSTCTTLRVHGRSTRFCTADVVPPFYFAGTVAEKPYWVTFMGLVDGVELSDTMRGPGLARGWTQKVSRTDPTLKYYFHPRYGSQIERPQEYVRPTEKMFRSIEKAVATLYVNGVVHGDLHHGNIMVSPRGRVTILDFGFATMIPPDLLPGVRSAVSDGDVDGAWYKTGLGEYVDWVLKTRGFEWYNPNAKVLRNLWSRIGTPPPPPATSTSSSKSNQTYYTA